LKVSDLLDLVKQAAVSLCVLQTNDVVHRDIAARNYLVTEDKQVKLSDFGMARLTRNDYYKSTEESAIAIRWSAPEVLNGMKFTTKSDLYSFGITMWEIFMKGAVPFSGLSNKELAQRLLSGIVPSLEKPPISDELHQLIVDLISAEPTIRPDYVKIMDRLGIAQNALTASDKRMKEQNNLYMKHSDLIAMTRKNANSEENNNNNNPNVYLRKDDNGKLTTSQQPQQPEHHYSSVETLLSKSEPKPTYEKSPTIPSNLNGDSYKKAPSSADLIETETDNDYVNPIALLDDQKKQ